MKKITILTIALLSFLYANAQKYSTTAPTGQTIYYDLYSGKAMLTYPGSVSYNPYAGYAKPTGHLVIPDSITRYGVKYPVTEIGEHALSNCDSLLSVSIPNTVKKIYNWAFSFDYALDSIIMQNSITEIGEYAFASCSALTYINLPDSVTSIGNSAFSGCSSLSSITIPRKVASLGNNAFAYCSNLSHIHLQTDSLIAAGNNNNPIFGINGNTSLSNVEIDSNVKVLPAYIFKGCTGIDSITIPQNIKNIGTNAFAGCLNLTTVIFNADSCESMPHAFIGCANLTTLTIGNNVRAVPNHAFVGCTGLTTVNCPLSLRYIGNMSFQNCTGLSTFTCPSTVEYIGSGAFYNCANLTNFSIPNISVIRDNTFKGCTSLTNITIPNSVSTIGIGAFESCNSLDSIIIPTSVSRIGWRAFAFCNSLSCISLPYSIDSIGCGAFGYCSGLSRVDYNIPNAIVTNVSAYESGSSIRYPSIFCGCNNLTTIYFGDSVRSIPAHSFSNSKITHVSLPDSVLSIGDYAFHKCDSLKSAILSNRLSYIGLFAFDSCANLDTVVMGDSVIEIDWYAFKDCSGLKFVSMSPTLSIIGNHAFNGCISLESIVIPSSVTSIGEGAFANCSNLDDIYVLTETPPSEVYNNNYYYYPTSYPCPTFFNTYNHALFHIPCGTTSLYQNSWQSWYNYSEPSVDYAYTVNSSDTLIGSAIVLRDIRCQDSSIVVIATMTDTHYHFSHWSNGNIANPDTLYLDGDSTITAIFERNQYAVTAYSNDTAMGYVEGGDAYLYQDTALLLAVPMEYYHFVQWSDGNIDNPRQWVVVTDTLFTAIFEADTFQLNIVSNNSTQGVVNGSGMFSYGIPVIISATANTGYHFTHWSNGNTTNPDTLYLVSDSTITAFFERNQYTLTVQSNNTSFGNVEGGGSYLYQDTAQLTANANETYHFVHWSDGNTDNPRNYIVTGNATITATFAIDTFHVSVVSNNIAYGGVSGEGDYQYGTPATVTATAYTGYHFSQWSNGITANPYTFAVLQDSELTAFFVEDGIQGIDDNVELDNVQIYIQNGQVIILGSDEYVYLYDISGRLLSTKQSEEPQIQFDIPTSGAYLIKVGNHPARKIVIVK